MIDHMSRVLRLLLRPLGHDSFPAEQALGWPCVQQADHGLAPGEEVFGRLTLGLVDEFTASTYFALSDEVLEGNVDGRTLAPNRCRMGGD